MNTLLIDSETTDLVPNSVLGERHQPRITEFFGHTIDVNGKVLHELEFMCNPGIKIPAAAKRITGITDEMLKDHPPFSHFKDAVLMLISQANAVVAHNLSYDKFVIDTELARCGSVAGWPSTQICTVEETEWYKGHRLNLGSLYEHLFGEPFAGAHRARQDVEALTRCFVELRKRGDV